MTHTLPLRLSVIAIALVVVSALHAQTTYTDLYEFDDAHGCCAGYPGILAQGRDGNLYGGTFSQGKYGFGTVFRMSVTGALLTLHDFDFTDGDGAQGGLSMGLDGNFYGTTYQGGGHSAGTVFQVTPDGTFTNLYSFTNGSDGAYPRTPPVPAPDGNLYGTTGNGTIAVAYRITPAGKFTVLATLPAQSQSPLIQGADGLLYGMTQYGGSFNQGTVFSLSTKGVLNILYSFTSTTGGQPLGPLFQANDGNFYGTASAGGPQSGGVVFKLTPSGSYTVLRNFAANDQVNGYTPEAGLVLGSDGFLYGFNSRGGATGYGTSFRLKTNGANFQVLYTFDHTHGGANPEATPVLDTNGVIYGLTEDGGFSDDGVFYSLNATLKPFVSIFVIRSGKIGATVPILGQGFAGASKVSFNGTSASFTVVSDTYLKAKVPSGATTGAVAVTTPSGTLPSSQIFRVTPQILNFDPPSGPVGTVVTITGASLTQTQGVGFGDRVPAQFTVDSDTQVTATVPAGAKTGPVGIQTKGGLAISSGKFTVTK
ncbi:MAG: hypothetical protein LAO09_06770 [Acidobacteriia bacterium]|nr:hypothetical protein [Terriglobia bacterium]